MRECTYVHSKIHPMRFGCTILDLCIVRRVASSEVIVNGQVLSTMSSSMLQARVAKLWPTQVTVRNLQFFFSSFLTTQSLRSSSLEKVFW